ncbi:hypothetical protein Ddye_024812 [Dipteronia dyeriana]|uniref:Glycosyltransferase n=1 Tax=Dipteronia dyeriana TaxID=168575 RepID=A0AAD9WTB8_9ROSI|nr:hypothetical protein Ddye_024812 [Dipteronia dyeriana]
MDTNRILQEQQRRSHIVAMPYPARGHINPMLILCKFLASKRNDILVTVILTEEYHRSVASEARPDNMVFATLSNDIIPLAHHQSSDVVGFFKAVHDMIAAPFEQLLDRLEPPVTTIITDNILKVVAEAANRRDIPVALFWPPSATTFSIFYHADLFENGIPVDMKAHGNDIVDFIPGIPSIRVADLPRAYLKDKTPVTLRCWPYKFSTSKVKCLLLGTAYELEPQVCDVFKEELGYPVYFVGPLIPYYELHDSKTSTNGGCDQKEPHYIEWLNSQPANSVLYISMGTLFSISSAQIDEMVAGLKMSGVRFLWVAREDTCRLEEDCRDLGLVVPWCHQLKVLCHSSVGGFLTHCGWNSILEAGYAGVPVLTLPLSGDQATQSKQAVEDYKIGLRLKKDMGDKALVTREEIAKTIKTLMDVDGIERKEFVKNAKKFQETCQAALEKGGSTDTNLDAFIQTI